MKLICILILMLAILLACSEGGRPVGFKTEPGKSLPFFARSVFTFGLFDLFLFELFAALDIIDTNYNGESFFVRHAYFTGGDKPYEKLKRALRAEINEEAWSMLYSTKSRPFDPPETGKIAIKVINHYGDEVLKVYEVNAVGQ